jgi:putative ABC transport system substrate-binding protein
MDRRAFITGSLSLLAAPLVVEAEPAAQDPRVGVLVPGSPASLEVRRGVEAFEQGLRELGYEEGQNVAIEYRFAEELSQLPELATDLVRLKADVIVAGGDPASLALKRITGKVPVVMAVSSDPVALGLVASFARPGGNMTGLTLLSPDVTARRLEVFQAVLPQPTRVAVLWNASNPLHAVAWGAMQRAAALQGDVTLQSRPVRGIYGVESALAAVVNNPPDGLIVLADPLIKRDLERIFDFAAAKRLPAMYEAREAVSAGGLMAYGINRPDLWRRAATYIDRILKGAGPADLPVEQPTKFELVINLKTAKALGLTIPPAVLARADEIIE